MVAFNSKMGGKIGTIGEDRYLKVRTINKGAPHKDFRKVVIAANVRPTSIMFPEQEFLP